MTTFEEIRAYWQARCTLTGDDPYLLSFDLPVGADGQRRQSIFLAELEDEAGRRYLRISTPVAAATDGDDAALRALRFNWEQRVGFLAVADLDGIAYLHLCENRPYEWLDSTELDRVVAEIGSLADRLEIAISAQDSDLH